MSEIVPPTADLGDDPLRLDLDDPEDELAVVDQQAGAGRDGGENLRVRHGDAGRVAELVVAIEDEALAGLQLRLAALEAADAQLRPLQIGDDRRRPAEHCSSARTVAIRRA